MQYQEPIITVPTIKKKADNSEWGTFKDSLRSPIHNWFPYPAGFSNKAVEHAIEKFNITKKHVIYDPFSGAGTTNIVAKTLGIKSFGMEAHPFIYFVAKTKSEWNVYIKQILEDTEKIEASVKKLLSKRINLHREFPELVIKCYSENSLTILYAIREAIKINNFSEIYKNFYNLALTCILRNVSNVGTGWPYIAPNKKKSGKDKDVMKEFTKMVTKMYSDIDLLRNSNNNESADCILVNGDSRDTRKYIKNNSVNFIFTSPPYLNNYDYADRTRLETYFFGLMHNWDDITNMVRKKLIMSATTQISRTKYNVEDIFLTEFKKLAPNLTKELQDKVNTLSKLRKTKGGKKSYDILAGGYFNDMFLALKDCYRVLKPKSKFLLILGDSAPYGVHFATDEILGKTALALGFSDYSIEKLRSRGEKWKKNPQRHSIPLKEVILYLTK